MSERLYLLTSVSVSKARLLDLTLVETLSINMAAWFRPSYVMIT